MTAAEERAAIVDFDMSISYPTHEEAVLAATNLHQIGMSAAVVRQRLGVSCVLFSNAQHIEKWEELKATASALMDLWKQGERRVEK